MPAIPRLVVALAAALAAAQALADPVPDAWRRAWPDTDFSQMLVPAGEIRSGGVPRDGIPAITAPAMIPVEEESGLEPREPVMVLAPEDGPARAYPVRYLMWHEIVNDTVAGEPVAVTFCPLCNTGIVFDRRAAGRTLEFGVSGMLRHSDLVMYDRETESWWQQATGEAIAGELAGETLRFLPARMRSWARFRAENPEGLVMAEPAGHARSYGRNPYKGYDTGRPFLYDGAPPPHGIDPLARVVQVGRFAWPLDRVREEGRIVEQGVVIDWQEGQASALDTGRIAEGREVGDITVTDTSTGKPVVHAIPFAFAFHAFEPEGVWMLGD